MTSVEPTPRRQLLKAAAVTAGGLAAASALGKPAAAAAPAKRPKICAFIKFVQQLPYPELAERIAEMGFDGIEATVRDGGHVLPERVEEDLPRLVEALRKHQLDITVMASSVSRVDQPHTEKVLRTAARLGVKRYRMQYYRYQANRSVTEQLARLRPVVKDLVQMNRELGLTALYQNHAGARFVGAPVWDLPELFHGYAAKDIGVAFDIRHATVEGGLAWPLHFSRVQSQLGAVYVKDFRWTDARQPVNVPLGKGRVDRAFFETLRRLPYRGVISLHVEYLHKGGLQKNLTALRDDLKTLRGLLKLDA